MNEYLEEKVAQVNYNGTMTAFGVTIISRYQLASDLVSMLELTERLANHNLHTHVSTLNYDSKANVCDIQCHPFVDPNSHDAWLIEQCARQHLSTFMLFGNDVYSEQASERPVFVVK